MEHDRALLHLLRLHHIQIQNDHVLIIIVIVVILIVFAKFLRAVRAPELAKSSVDDAKTDYGRGEEKFRDVRYRDDLLGVVLLQVEHVEQSVVELRHEQVLTAHVEADFEKELKSARAGARLEGESLEAFPRFAAPQLEDAVVASAGQNVFPKSGEE